MPAPQPQRLRRRDLRRSVTRMSRGDKVVMAVCLPTGIVLFVGTLAANLMGHVLLPFDPHHFFGQVGGLVLIAVAVSRWR